MKGYRTLALNGLIVALGALMPWVAGVDWTQYVAPETAALIIGAANIGLRLITTTAVGGSK